MLHQIISRETWEQKENRRPRSEQPVDGNVDGLAYRATDFDFASGNVTRAITAKAWRELTPPQAWCYDRESSVSTLGGALRTAALPQDATTTAPYLGHHDEGVRSRPRSVGSRPKCEVLPVGSKHFVRRRGAPARGGHIGHALV